MTFFYLWRKMFNPGLKKQPGIVGRKLSHEEAHHRITGQGGGGATIWHSWWGKSHVAPATGGGGGLIKSPLPGHHLRGKGDWAAKNHLCNNKVSLSSPEKTCFLTRLIQIMSPCWAGLLVVPSHDCEFPELSTSQLWQRSTVCSASTCTCSRDPPATFFLGTQGVEGRGELWPHEAHAACCVVGIKVSLFSYQLGLWSVVRQPCSYTAFRDCLITWFNSSNLWLYFLLCVMFSWRNR